MNINWTKLIELAVAGIYIAWVEWRLKSTQAKLREANFENTKAKIDKDVAALPDDQLKSKLDANIKG